MKIFSRYSFDVNYYFSKEVELWIDKFPKRKLSSDIKRVLLLIEPNIIRNKEKYILNGKFKDFDLILTHNENILKKCKNAILHEHGTTFIKNYNIKSEKKFSVTTLIGGKKLTPNHLIRHELLKLKPKDYLINLEFYNSLRKPFKNSLFYNLKKFFNKELDKNNIKLLQLHKDDKIDLFNSQFHIAIENVSTKNYFTEKIIDCFQTKTIPIYIGCINISNWFDVNGIYICKNISDIKKSLREINEKSYLSKLKSINYNFEQSNKYRSFESQLYEKISLLFKSKIIKQI